ncbi:hypothetical protein [Salinirubrum litoreum]|uniref:Molybdopterin cofactor biosynthesis MoaD-related C-terminal domain-containing protein n=1 Tax=Salinirubrum litoreum TaxID=1126234 RepID=A0ABD5RDQ6_9EURY|nr:hypothetical protein [Salinirubrum litoreum]
MSGDQTAGADDDRDDWPHPPADVPDDWLHRDRAFRGISVRLAVHYLGNLGGEVVAETENDEGRQTITVAGDGWRARLSSVEVGVGPTVSLTEVRIAFAGDPDGLEALLDRFAQKAMRAGG